MTTAIIRHVFGIEPDDPLAAIVADQLRAAVQFGCGCAFFTVCAFMWIGTP